MSVNMNLSNAQVEAIERILDHRNTAIEVKETMFLFADNRTLGAFIRNSIVSFDNECGIYTLTHYGIQSYCATILTKYDGPTHERIHAALTNYQRLFNS